MVRRNLVVIGGSAGAVEAVAYLLGELPADFPGYTLVVLHLAATSNADWLRATFAKRCRLNTLADGADDELDRTLWAAIRMFEQRVNISRMLGEQQHAQGRPQRAQQCDSRARESQRHAQTLRELHQRRRLVMLDESDE